MKNLPKNCYVILRTFNGTSHQSENGAPEENYWKLIGETGYIIEPINQRNRVLVQFEVSVTNMGLHCHNPIPNSLYILESDLEKISD